MVDPPSDSGPGPGNRSVPPGMPRWVKIFGLIALLVIAVLILVMLLVGGEHGPGLHAPSGDSSAAPLAHGWLAVDVS